MIRLIRIMGFLLIVAGAVVIATWMIKPLRLIWPWLGDLPWQIKIGLGAAAVGLLILVGSLIWERMEDREQDKKLLDDD